MTHAVSIAQTARHDRDLAQLKSIGTQYILFHGF